MISMNKWSNKEIQFMLNKLNLSLLTIITIYLPYQSIANIAVFERSCTISYYIW